MCMKKAIAVLLATAAISLVGCANTPTDTKNPDASAVQPIPSLQQNDITYRNASGSWMHDGEKFVSSSANSIAVADGEVFDSGTLSCTVRTTNTTDSGLIFRLNDNGNGYFWEQNVSYYFYFLGQGGTAYLGKVNNGGWYIMYMVNIGAIDASHDYKLRAVIAENRITCFVDDELMFGVKDHDFLSGNGYGIRTGATGVTFDNVSASPELDYSLGEQA